MSVDFRCEKSLLRQKYLQIRRQIPKQTKALYDEKLYRYIISSASYKYYDTILLYAALEDEPDLDGAARHAAANGKRIAYPRCIPERHEMEFIFVGDPSELTKGYYGIREPAGHERFDPSKQSCSLCLIPALTVDRHGFRIGYGGGYYDRFLAKYSGTTAAVVYSELISEELPHGKYDVACDVIFTERGVMTVDKDQA